MESGRAPLAFEEDSLGSDPDNEKQTEATWNTDCDTQSPNLLDLATVPTTKQTSESKPTDTELIPFVQPNTDWSDNFQSDSEPINTKPSKISNQFNDKDKGDNSNENKDKGDNCFEQSDNSDTSSCLPTYSDVQETCLTDNLSGAGPYVQDTCVADDPCPADDHPSLQVVVADDDVDSNTELFAQEQIFTPGRYRKEFLCGMFLKYSIFIFNFLFWVAAVCGFGFGYWVLTAKGQIFTTGVYLFLDPAVMLCIASCTIFIVAFFGFLGALRENLLLLKIFRVCLILVLLVQTGIGILVFVFYTMPEARESLLAGPESVLKDAIKGYHDDKDRQEWIDLIQKEFKCCGISQTKEGYKDWQVNMYFNCSERNPSIQRCAVPVSCCIFEPGDYVNVMCGFHTTDQPREKVLNRIYTKGCMRGLADWMRGNESYIGGFLLGFVTPQVLGVIFSTLYIKHIKKSRSRWRLLKRTQ